MIPLVFGVTAVAVGAGAFAGPGASRCGALAEGAALFAVRSVGSGGAALAVAEGAAGRTSTVVALAVLAAGSGDFGIDTGAGSRRSAKNPAASAAVTTIPPITSGPRGRAAGAGTTAVAAGAVRAIAPAPCGVGVSAVESDAITFPPAPAPSTAGSR